MSADRPTPVNPHLSPVVAMEAGNGNGQDHRRDDDPPFREPRTPLEIAANCASEAKAAALHASGMAGEAFGAAARTESAVKTLAATVDRLALDVGGIAKAVGAKRTFSGQVRLSVPPSEPVTIHTTRVSTDTGEHARISDAEIERLSRTIADLQAEDRGAKIALAERDAAEEKSAANRKELREKIVVALGLASAIASLAYFVLTHVH